MTKNDRAEVQSFVASAVKKSRPHLAKQNIDYEEFMALCMQALARNPDLYNVDRDSLALAVGECAHLGLKPDGRSAAIVGFKGKAQLMTMYGGLLDVARRELDGVSFTVEVARKGDRFEYENGLVPVLRHTPDPEGDGSAEITHAYAIARYHKWPGPEFAVLTRKDIDRHRSAAQSGSLAWANHYPAMAKKSALREVLKLLPIRGTTWRILERDNQEEPRQEAEPLPVARALPAPTERQKPVEVTPTPAKEPVKVKKSAKEKSEPKPEGRPYDASHEPPPPDDEPPTGGGEGDDEPKEKLL